MWLKLPGRELIPFPMSGKSMLMFNQLMELAKNTPGSQIIVLDCEFIEPNLSVLNTQVSA